MNESQHTLECSPVRQKPCRPDPRDVAENRLRRNAYLALQQISCDFRDGVLILNGRLPSYYLKQVAQGLVTGIDAVERIDNQIEVMTHSLRHT
jgi:hypothetical protein